MGSLMRLLSSELAKGGIEERRPVKQRAMLIYTAGRSYLLEFLRAEMQTGQVRIVDGPTSRCPRAGLETDARKWSRTGKVDRLG
jgi:hypothetical protein